MNICLSSPSLNYQWGHNADESVSKTCWLSSVLLLIYPHSHASLNSSKMKKSVRVSSNKQMIRKKYTTTTKLKKEKDWWGLILQPLSCEAKTKPLGHCDKNNFLFQILQTSFQKNQKNLTNFHKPHIEIINEVIMLTNLYRKPAGNFYRFLDKSASLFI